MLREPPKFEGPGEHFVQTAGEAGGYTAWIRSEAGKSHRITLQFWVPVAQVGSESHLTLTVPAATVSELQLQVPVENALARVAEGGSVKSVQPAAGGKTTVDVVGLEGELNLAWHAANTEVARLATVLEASAVVAVRIDGRNVSSDAKLTVRSFGGEFDRFQVRLPPGAQFVPTPQTGSTVTVASDSPQGRICDVVLGRKTAGPVEVRLAAQRAYQPQANDKPLELAGFEVIGAVRQWGTVAVQVEGNWQVQWGELRQVRQTDELAGLLGHDDPTAEFEYSVQPYALPARIMPQETRVRVAADYQLSVGGSEARLRGKLKYNIRGAKVRSLEVDAPGWDIDLVSPANVVNVDAVAAGQNDPLVIPLLQASSGELEINFEAQQPISPATGKVSLRLPVPRGQMAAGANVTVVAADNVEFAIVPDETRDLLVQPIGPRPAQLPERQQESIYLRTAGESPVLVGTLHVHSQEISTAAATRLEVDNRQTRVDQQMSFQVAYEPTDRLILGVPRAVRIDRLAVTMNGQRLLPAALRERADDGSSDTVPVKIPLPEPRIGRCDLQVQYSVPHEQPASQTTSLVEVPLVIPGEGVLTSNRLTIEPASGISVSYPKGPWQHETQPGEPAELTGLRLSAASAIPRVALAVSFKERHLEQATTIEQAWIQTRLTGAQRQDRAMFRLTSSEPGLRLTLPAGADLSSLVVELDGHSVRGQLDTQGDARSLVVPLTPPTTEQRLLELRYHFSDRPARGSLTLEAPRLIRNSWIQQFYWQLLLPNDEHVLGVPADFAREYRWVWSGLVWQREPALEELELESWIGNTPGAVPSVQATGPSAPGKTPGPSQAASSNQYLYSTLGDPQPLHLYTISRARLVLFASLPLLLAGLLLIYVPATRHPGVLFTGAVAVAAVALVDPESALLVGQAAVLGLCLAGVAYALARMSLRPTPPAAPVRGSSRAMQRAHSEIFTRSIAAPRNFRPPPIRSCRPLPLRISHERGAGDHCLPGCDDRGPDGAQLGGGRASGRRGRAGLSARLRAGSADRERPLDPRLLAN